MTDLWHADRLQIIGSVLTRYSDYIQVGHRIREGMEGDPCSSYRSARDAPCGTVTSIDRTGNSVTLTVAMDDGRVKKYGNTSVLPNEIWEVDPDDMEAFKKHVDNVFQGGSSESGIVENVLQEDVFGAVTTGLQSLEERFRQAEHENKVFRETVAGTIRHLASDLLRTAHGQAIEFAPKYADRYDMAMTDTMDEKKDAVPFQGAADDSVQDAKLNFTPINYASLHDEENGTDLSGN